MRSCSVYNRLFVSFGVWNLATSVAVSAWTLVAISLERYYAICHPLRSRQWQTLKHAYKLIAIIWLGSLLFMSPIAILSRLIPTNHGNWKWILMDSISMGGLFVFVPKESPSQWLRLRKKELKRRRGQRREKWMYVWVWRFYISRRTSQMPRAVARRFQGLRTFVQFIVGRYFAYIPAGTVIECIFFNHKNVMAGNGVWACKQATSNE